LESGERLTADTIICNADLPYAEKALVAPSRSSKPNRRYSCSAFMLYLDYAGALPNLLHHNVFFGADFEGNLADIFNRGRLPDDPAFYACISSRSDSSKASAGHENLYILVPCPNLDRPWSDADGEALTARVFQRLTTAAGFDPAKVVAKQTYTPLDWRDQLNLDRGAAFGLSHHFNQSAYFRPANRSTVNSNLYYVGASTTPGNGLPMVLISADLIVDRLKHDGIL
jgi:phytoene desaturase